MDDFSYQWKINGLNHNLRLNLDAQRLAEEEHRRKNWLKERAEAERHRATNSVFNPYHIVCDIRDRQTDMILDPDNIVFTPRKK